MDVSDSSIHGLPLGPVPIVLGIWSAVLLVLMFTRTLKINRNNVMAVYGLSPIVPTLLFLTIGGDARGDLSFGRLLVGSVGSAAVAILLHGILWLRTDVPPLGVWYDWRSLPVLILLKRFLASSILFLFVFAFLMFTGLSETKCATGYCRGAAIMFGSNLSSGAGMWLVSSIAGFGLSLSLANAAELFRRMIANKHEGR